MSNRTQTLNFTTASTASGASVDTNSTSLPDHLDIVYISVTQSGTAGPFDFKIFKKDGYAAADLLAYWSNVQPSLYYPIDNDTGSEAEEGFPIPYDDEDASGETHIRITNKDTAAHTYTVTIRYIEAPQMQSTGRPIFRAGLSLKDADVAHGVTDITETTSFYHVDIDSGTEGGARVWGFSDTVGQRPMALHGVFGQTDPTDTVPAIAIVGSKRSGTGRAALGAAETVLKIINYTTDLITVIGDGTVVPPTDNTFDIGLSATRFRSMYLGTQVQVGVAASSPTVVAASAVTSLNFTPLSGGALSDGTLTRRVSEGLSIVGVAGSANDFSLYTPGAGTALMINPTGTASLVIGGGFVVGAGATGGYKGVGTINCSADVYKNNSAYANPDFVLEHWATGRIVKFAGNEGADSYRALSLDEVRYFAEKNYYLPQLDFMKAHGEDGVGVFKRADAALMISEDIFRYLFELDDRLRILESV